jgi:hypothetical protein
MSRSKAEIEKDIEATIARYFGPVNRPEVREVPFESLSQRVALKLEGGKEVYVLIPFDGCNIPPDWEAITEYAKQHSEVKALLWLNGEVKEL